MRKGLYQKVKNKSQKLLSNYDMIGPFAVMQGYRFMTNIKKEDLLKVMYYNKYVTSNRYKIIDYATDYSNRKLGDDYLAVYIIKKNYSPTLEELKDGLYKKILGVKYEDVLMHDGMSVSDEMIEKRARETYNRSMRGDRNAKYIR
ncbi:MAG: hypothetical protein JEZ08_15360 [Clostridiales bacterium]|nr:hypothetical protein [Clostridiales bacterium]